MKDVTGELKEIAERVVAMAVKAGADAAEVQVADGLELGAKVRLGEPELVQEAGSRGLGLRVFRDHRQAVTYTSDLRTDSLLGFAADSVDLASLAEPDELNYLPEKDQLATGTLPDLDLYDPETESLDAATALAKAIAGEKAARDFDKRVTNSEGASYGRVLGAVALANSAGFSGAYRGSYSSLSVEPVCDDADGKMRNGYWWTGARFVSKLDDPEFVGQEAARRTLAQLGSKKVDTCEVPIVFDPEAGRAIVGMVFGVANGSSFYRKTTYMLGRENEEVASKLVTITDDPHIVQGPGSKPFDGDGLPTRVNTVVEGGILRTVLCDTYTARKLNRQSTGSAGRGTGSGPSPTTSNLIMKAGTTTRDELIAQTKRGLLVTSMMGFGFNPITGDFSRGASGFWIENGEIAFPVSEITISANFDDLLKRIDCVADDLVMRTSTACPTFRVSSMTLAGR